MGRRKQVKRGDSNLAIGYVRVSTAEQQHGPKAQADALARWAAREGVQLLAIFVDLGVSGAIPLSERPGLIGAMAALREVNAGTLVAAKRDRLARDTSIVKAIEAQALSQGATVRTADGQSDATGSAGVIAKGIHDLLGEWERAVIRERTTAALAVKRARGERISRHTPYGYRTAADGVRLELDPVEQATIALARELRAQGLTFQGVIGELAGRGHLSRAGRPFTLSAIHRMISSAPVPAE